MTMQRIFDIIDLQVEKYALPDALNRKTSKGWQAYSSTDVRQIVNQISGGLLNLGVQKGDKIAIASSNRPEWNLVDLGAQQIGAISVPIYPTMSLENYAYICKHAEVKIAFVEDQPLYDKIFEATNDYPLQDIFTFEQLPEVKYWQTMLETNPNISKIASCKDQVTADDLLTIIYTSGTTGTPKGVMLTHRNIITNLMDVDERVPGKRGASRVLSFLPLSHIFERTGVYAFMYMGFGIYYAESMEKIADNIKEVKPHFFDTVPRLLEKIYDKIMAKGEEAGGIKKWLLNWAVQIGLEYEPHLSMPVWKAIQLDLARAIVFKKWREALGGNIETIFVGGAALQPRLARVFWAAEIPVCEAYGLTETSPGLASCLPTPKGMRAGTVGFPFGHVQIKIAEDGEILAKGDSIMQGYYKEPEKTNEVLKDGWFHTGDIGMFTEGGFLKITDRKKEMFKTSGGKYIAPQVIENKLKESYFIEQVMVVGEGKKFPSALVVPNFEAVKSWATEVGLRFESPAQVIKEPKFLQKMEQEVKASNEGLGSWEQIKKFVLLPELWSIEGGELTPKMSLKRRVILEKFTAQIEELYQQPKAQTAKT
ncbi:MAG: AMP-dependent synthetase/ligase [Bernardetiaceae bacterium]